MHFQFLIEDYSGEVLITQICNIISSRFPNSDITYNIKSFRGIGGFTPKNTVKETKTGKLLNDLATYLKGFDKALRGMPASVFIVLDNDDRNTDVFMSELVKVAEINNITIDHVFCIAVEEMEAWLLGDEAAILKAYPKAKVSVLHSYVQDSICGTWEKLADVVYSGGMKKLRKECTTYIEVGKIKSEWAKNIGQNMDIDDNKSDSFNHFIREVQNRCRNTDANSC